MRRKDFFGKGEGTFRPGVEKMAKGGGQEREKYPTARGDGKEGNCKAVNGTGQGSREVVSCAPKKDMGWGGVNSNPSLY